MQELLGQTPIFCKTLTQVEHFTVARVVLAYSSQSQKVHKKWKAPCSTTVSCLISVEQTPHSSNLLTVVALFPAIAIILTLRAEDLQLQ